MIQTKKINQILSNINTKNPAKYSIYIDNLHSPYILLDKEYLMPSVSNFNLNTNECTELSEIYSQLIPELLIGNSLLPEPKPKREHSKLCYADSFNWMGGTFIFLLKIEVSYLGGSSKNKIVKPATQSNYPSYYTDRIYFSTRIFAVQDITHSDGNLSDFTPISLKESLYLHEPKTDITSKPKIFSELFDEIDYKQILEPILTKLHIRSDEFKLLPIYSPIGIEMFSLVIRFLNSSKSESIKEFQKFSEIVSSIHTRNDINTASLKIFHEWFRKHRTERELSPSGNVRWKIIQE
jgi:hypothetical protein